ncbi:hypothetical protein [Streptomyces sp. SP18CS02]|uniref:hypothetical protein n=1 Tax=Streptomyces sp. SP18CS02 TaxID=3002531 RepID=UPI002E7A919E|nr:hypothetical protein [Streptomyces sp. SP18CS02]MEE1757431.1 hypothetical protein [Streptomyces sp. SP18CS02]
MPLKEPEWDLVTRWVREYLLDTTDPHTQLAAEFPPEFVSALPLTAVSSENARALVQASRRTIERQLRLVEVIASNDRLSVRPEVAKAHEFLERLREDQHIHLSRDNFRTCVLKNGTEVFIDRQSLRETLRGFVEDPEKWVLLVDGAPGSGRSYTYNLIRHIGQHSGFRPARVTLTRTSTAVRVLRRLAEFVADPHAGVSPLNPTELNDLLPSIDDAVHWIVGRATAADDRFWIVFDECDKLDPSSDVWDFIGKLSLAIYEHASVRGDQVPRLVLLGYGPAMRQLPYDVRGSLCRDTARVAEAADLRCFFDQYFHESPPAALADAGEATEAAIADLVEVAVEEVLRAASAGEDSGESYMRKVCTATEGAIRVYRSL